MHKLMIVMALAVVACGKGDGKEAKSSKPRDMVAERAAITGFKDRACACTDAACANKVADDLKAYMSTDRGEAPKGTAEEAKADADVLTEFIKCLDAARAPK